MSDDGTICLNPATTIATSLYTSITNWFLSFLGDFKWQNTLFVSASTVFNTLLALTVLYFWWANRQFHFKKRKKDGSRLSQLATHKDALKLNARKRQQQRRKSGIGGVTSSGVLQGGDTQSSSSDEDYDADSLTNLDQGSDGDDEEEEEEADLSDYDTDDEDDDETNGAADGDNTQQEAAQEESMQQLSPEKRRNVRDLTSVVANMEVFSYLSKQAFVQCLEFMEYVDLKQNQTLFNEDSYDGSLYAVVSGQVKCQFEFAHSPLAASANVPSMDEDNNEGEPFISFTAGDGDVVTSLLSMLAGLVRKCQERGQSNSDKNSGVNSNDSRMLTSVVPPGISVTAIGVAETTRLVRVPPECFLAIMDKFPRDVYRIAQTIIARMQRVTIQTVVRCLGLQKEIVRRHYLSWSMDQLLANRIEATNAWKRLQQTLLGYLPDAAAPQLRDQVNKDAALVAAVNLMGTSTSAADVDQNDSSIINALVQRLQEMASVNALPPGQTLIETGQKPDAIYLILRGSLDVGMHVSGTSNAATQSTRRTSTYHKDRRSIFPRGSATGPTGAPPRPDPLRRKHSSGGEGSSSTRTKSSIVPTNFSRVYKAGIGETVGTLSCFTGDVSIVTVRNSSEWETALLYKVSKDVYDSLLAECPSALTECLGAILDRLASPIGCLLDWNVEWMHVQAGEDVVRRGEECDAMYAVLNGRLRSAVPHSPGISQQHHPPPQKTATHSSQKVRHGPRPSFLSRAKQRLRNRKDLLQFLKKSNPKVANAPPRRSHRMMNSAGEEFQGDEFHRGAIIGEVEILTGADWNSDVYASRHSELARVPSSVLNAIIRMYPRAGLNLARIVASQIQQKIACKKKTNAAAVGGPPLQMQMMDNSKRSLPSTETPGESSLGNGVGQNILPSYGLNLSTIAIVPLVEGSFDIDGFSKTLQKTLDTSIAPTKLMSKSFARSQLGEDVFRQRNAMHGLKMTRLCGDMEENFRLVVYQAEMNYTWWTRLCIQQADCVLLVVRAEEAPPKRKVEACLSWAFAALNVKIQLVVLQSPKHNKNCEDDADDETFYETMESSDQLNDWSEARHWIAGHHLVRMPFEKHVLDFRRLCRRITGRSIGVVLGGGGARGLAHIGVIQALVEAGITIDFVGGTSQGAYIGALLAMQPDDLQSLVRAARQMAETMSNNWERLFDLTLPLVSFFSGYRFNRGIQKSLGRRRIQDLVCNFFCVSTDLRNNTQVVHTKGICWRYVRASMTLQSYLPPLSEDGTLLVDGGYMNVLPADVMKLQMRARTVIAVDVSPEVRLDNFEYGTHLNGWWLLWNSWNPFTKTVNIPSMGDISERLAWVSGERHRKKVREYIDLFLQPPVGNFGTLEYDKFDEIVSLGYEYAKPRVDNFVRKNPHLIA